MRILLTQEDIDRSYVYANGVIETVDYLIDKNQANKQNILFQHLIGKEAEFGVKHWFDERNIECSPVDDIVTRNKSFAPDLTVADIRTHVKSKDYELAKKYGASWLFELNGANRGSGNRDREVFDNYRKTDCVIFCIVKQDEWVEIAAVIPIKTLHENNMFKNPQKESLIGVKKAVYLVDIPPEYWRTQYGAQDAIFKRR